MGTIHHQHHDSREVSAMATSLPAWLCQHIVAHTQDAVIFADGEGITGSGMPAPRPFLGTLPPRRWGTRSISLFLYPCVPGTGKAISV